jgi:DNA helicase IV
MLLDVEDDVFDLDALTDDDRATLGGEGALLAALARKRTGRMRDIVETIQAEQDAVIRADIGGVLVVYGGPGTGKTAVALHRAAYLLYTHRDTLARTGVLVVGPNSVFLRYIEQVLPSLGETGVVLSTLEGLVPGVTVTLEESDDIAKVKSDASMADRVADAVAAMQRVPDQPLTVGFDEHELLLTPGDIDRARTRARRSGRRHNRARYVFAKQLLRRLVHQVVERDSELAGQRWVVQSLMRSDDFRDVVNACWPLASANELVERMYADDPGLLHREPGSGWTAADIPVLDEAWALLGDPGEVLEIAAARRRQQDDTQYAREVLAATGLSDRVDAATLARRYAEPLTAETIAARAGLDAAWHYGHVIVDEAQELSPMAWRMLARRCPSRSMTVVGDLAQASSPWAPRTWAQAMDEVAPGRWRAVELTVNYRTPAEVMALAGKVLHAVDPAAALPRSVRETGVAPVVTRAGADELVRAVVAAAREAHDVVAGGLVGLVVPPALLSTVDAAVRAELAALVGEALESPVSVLSVAGAKGLEFDAVVLVEPGQVAERGPAGLRDLYVALTRATQRLYVVHSGELPAALDPH